MASHQAAADLAEYVNKNVEAIAALDAREERHVTRHERAAELASEAVARPATVYVVVAVIVGWSVCNGLAPLLGLHPVDPPPFPWLQGAIGTSALLTTMLVVTQQNRQAKLAERWAHLDLQVNLLAEQRTAKLISLIEELRRDLPSVRDRRDPEAEAMTEAADPRVVLSALRETLDAEPSTTTDPGLPPPARDRSTGH